MRSDPVTARGIRAGGGNGGQSACGALVCCMYVQYIVYIRAGWYVHRYMMEVG